MSARPARSLVRIAVEYLPSVIVPAVANVLFIAIFSRRLGRTVMGEYFVALSLIGIGAILAGSWLQQPILRFESGSPLEGHRRFHLAMFAAMPVTGAVFWAGALLVQRMTGLLIPTAFTIGILVVSETWFRLFLSILQARSRSVPYSFATSALALGRFGGALAFYHAGHHDLSCLLDGWLATQLVLVVALFAGLGYPRRSGGVRDTSPLRSQLAEYASYGIPMLGFMLLSELRPFTDRMVLGEVLAPAAVGLHGSNYALGSNVVGLLAMPLMLAVHPHLMMLANRPAFDEREFRHRTGELTDLFLQLCILLLLGLVPMSLLGSKLVLGPEFAVGYRVLSLAALGTVFSGLVTYLSKGLEARKRTVTALRCNLIAYALSAATTITCVELFGYIGASMGFAIGAALYAAIVWFATEPALRPALPWRTLAILVVAFGAGMAVPELLGPSWLAVAIGVGAAGAWVLYLAATGGITRALALARRV